MIFFHDKHWYKSEPLFAVEEDDEEEEEDELRGDDDATLKNIKIEGSMDNTPATSDSLSASHTTTTSSQPPTAALTKKPEYEFLLFNYLLRFVHREGEIGEFARAGLLFLMDVAMSPNEAANQEATHANSSDQVDPVNDAALALAEYILDGDFSDVLGAGLGAVYSLLPSKLAFYPQSPSSDTEYSMKIGVTSIDGDDLLAIREKYQAMGMEDARSPEFKAKIDHFLTILVFIQDVLRRNDPQEGVDASALVGTAIVQNILDAIRRIFLENVLYPSILECSDGDGSAVAVMSYIEIVVRTLREGPLANLFVDFLVSEDNDDTRLRKRPQSMVTLGDNIFSSEEKRKKHKRRQSSAMILLEMEAPESRKPTDYFTSMARFTLKDLLLSNLKSKRHTAATSALQLLQTMLIFHSQITTDHILLVASDAFATSFPHPALLLSTSQGNRSSVIIEEDGEGDDEDFRYPGAEKGPDFNSVADESLFIQPETTYSTHERETALYLGLVSRVDPLHDHGMDSFSTGYDRYLHDAILSIQRQPVYWQTLEESGTEQPRYKHRLHVNDPILSRLLESLTTFFSNTPDFNVGLTGVLATLTLHPDRSLAGWITFAIAEGGNAPAESRFNGQMLDDDGDDRSIDFNIEEKLANDTNILPAASIDEKSRPVIYTIYHGLVTQLERYRQCVEHFDKFLLERRRGLLFSENLTDALSLGLDPNENPPGLNPEIELVQKPKPKPKQSASSSLVSFLTPRKSKTMKPVPEPTPATPPQSTLPKLVIASPFGTHYQHTGSLKVEPFIPPISPSGIWTPSSKKFTAAEEDVFGPAWNDTSHVNPEEEEINEKLPSVSLSHLLDNVVILEESIKELVAIIHARRSLGIDSLRYL
jgi:hypothetical protein